MGANTSFLTFEDSLGKEKIKQLWADAVSISLYHDGHSYSGEIGMLGPKIAQWYDAPVGEDTISQADAFICEKHEKWRAAIARSFVRDGKKMWLVGGWCSS